ncbi:MULTISPECIES: hypothetical protein [unclassified Lentimonas]|uniref:hypothetical protein n=1 Tax=unclassified Lentimonas TaxID=2630993 RepID=UPI001328F9B4|nr:MULTISPECIES: hypothetical protein [unclassified Lentimonas]CAA6676368.1 Unannotated [Lentimonas sp. CC4]CAA6685206.1 Unannotated [Lentimonas sp. CC6]CAA6693389.1 Unannotated [Lentimonas sp. CC19]CAA6696494.1 Unannotated [Lentimonas sp. CC10]CAA7072397.1 Unannotated [Lentimonas sp. CC11]
MTLFQATLYTGIFLIAFGGHYLWHGMKTAKRTQAFPRSTAAAYLLLGTAAAWFLYKVLNLGPADFGQYKKILFLIFLVTAVGSFYFVPDFLAVRGLAALTLLTSGVLLDAAYMQLPQARLFLVTFIYAAIVVSLILGANPYKLRDFFDWLYKADNRPRIFGGVFAAYGLLLIGVAFTY